MPRNWRIATHDTTHVNKLCRDLGISPLLAQVLAARGYQNGDAAKTFLRTRLTDLHEPEGIPNLSAAADRLVDAVRTKRRITIYGDYDVDGVTSTSLLWHCLRLSGANVDYYIPCRLEEGYGLNVEAIRQMHEEDPSRLVVTVDCGICSVVEAAAAKELGLELIVTDHHQMDEQLPDALCVHPRLPGSTYPFGDLCGVGVAFKLAWAICQRLGDGKKASPRMRDFLIDAVGLAAIGTIADVVPLVGENRVIVKFGLDGLQKRSGLGLKQLLDVCGIDGKGTLQAEDIAFNVAPRINAAGRLGQARLAVELLTTDQPDRAASLAKYLDELNKNRQTVERRMLRQAKEFVDEHPDWQQAPALVLASEEWHPGVIGIVAGRVAEHFEKPAAMIAINAATGIGQGSCRTYAGCDLHTALQNCADHLLSYGGHRAAAGLRISSNEVAAFRDRFCQFIGETHVVADDASDLHVDAEVRLGDITRKAVLELDLIGPFGAQNARPVLTASHVELAAPPKKMGEGERHLSLMLKQHGSVLRAIAFGRGEWADEIARENRPIHASFAPIINRFRGRENVELQLIDWKPT